MRCQKAESSFQRRFNHLLFAAFCLLFFAACSAPPPSSPTSIPSPTSTLPRPLQLHLPRIRPLIYLCRVVCMSIWPRISVQLVLSFMGQIMGPGSLCRLKCRKRQLLPNFLLFVSQAAIGVIRTTSMNGASTSISFIPGNGGLNPISLFGCGVVPRRRLRPW